ncbi:MAG: hypothetical protein JO069_05050 [Verrucomicrobia bacterium]|nr:hypothetical protein [Verrucomicrobiota bacterium]
MNDPTAKPGPGRFDLNRIRHPLEKKLQLTPAQGFPERVFMDLWSLLPPAAVRRFTMGRPASRPDGDSPAAVARQRSMAEDDRR